MTMIRIMYPNTKGARLDGRYYVDTHMSLTLPVAFPASESA
jgi:hypothetical protein